MQFFIHRRIVTFWIVATGALMIGGSFMRNDAPVKKKYWIENGSKLFLKGSSNVNQFTCDCYEQFSTQTFEAETQGVYSKFSNTQFKIPVKKFDCHNGRIDADMQKALQANRHPFIQISISDCKHGEKVSLKEWRNWVDIKANVAITIAGSTQKECITAQARSLGNNRYAFRGEKNLYMSSFGISPPEAMFGMIKVNDVITFHFDLIVSVSD